MNGRAWRRGALSFCCGVGMLAAAEGAETPGLRITRVIKEVKISSPRGPHKNARLGELVPAGGSLSTGTAARTELTFADRTVARIGAKSACELAPDSRSLRLKEGALLFQSPAAAREGVKITTGGITIEIRGATGVVERHQDFYVKILVLAGTARVFVDRVGESVLVTPGQMLITKPGTKTLPDAVHFEIAKLYRTSLLTNADFSPLTSREEILREMQKQQSDPAFIPTNLVIHGRGTLVNLMPPTSSPAVSPSPSPRKPAHR